MTYGDMSMRLKLNFMRPAGRASASWLSVVKRLVDVFWVAGRVCRSRRGLPRAWAAQPECLAPPWPRARVRQPRTPWTAHCTCGDGAPCTRAASPRVYRTTSTNSRAHLRWQRVWHPRCPTLGTPARNFVRRAGNHPARAALPKAQLRVHEYCQFGARRAVAGLLRAGVRVAGCDTREWRV